MPIGFSFSYRRFPKLRAYIERTGAVELNFKKFMIRSEHNQYYREKSLIWISPDFALFYKNIDEEAKATEAEAAEIKAELEAAKADGTLGWPHSIEFAATQIKSLKRSGLLKGGKLYEFRCLAGDGYLMCQERNDLPDGGKEYIPFTLRSDGKWYAMEPDGDLPFWKPRDRTPGQAIMVHEGAKTAAFISYGLENGTLTNHPWYEEIRDYAHWGWIGGALAPHRTNYAELKSIKPSEVVYVCDNDDEGKSAISTISKMYGNKMDCVMFTDDFKQKFDLADAMPSGLYGPPPVRRWLGPALAHLTRAATWATEFKASSGEDKPKPRLRRIFAKQWCHSVKPEVYINTKRSDQLFSEREFNHMVRPFSDVKETHELMKQDEATKSVTVAYHPAKPPGIYTENGRPFINTHAPSIVRPRSGNPALFDDFLVQLVPDAGERMVMKKWLATLVTKPDIKMGFAILLVSETQGTGKTTFQYIAEAMVGADNTSWPPESEIVDSNYTYWCARKRLACISEIYQGHSYKAYNKLKDKITDSKINVAEKYLAHYTMENWLHIIACSNDRRALKLDNDDRRWFVPSVVEDIQDRAYWDTLYNWLRNEDGYGIIMAQLKQFAEDGNTFSRSDRAPKSRAKTEMVKETYSDGQKLVDDYLNVEAERADGKAIVTWDEALREMVRMQCHDGRRDRLEKCLTLRKVAREAGWHIGESRVCIDRMGMAYKARLIATTKEAANMANDTYERLRDEVVVVDNPLSRAMELNVIDNRI